MAEGDAAGTSVKKKEPPERKETEISINSSQVIICLSLVSVIVAAGVYVINRRTPYEDDLYMVLGEKGKFLFNAVDLNEDRQLSVEEFAPLVERLTGVVPPSQRSKGDGKAITLETSFKPLEINTMRISKDVASFMDAGPFLVGLKGWETAREKKGEIDSSEFKTFLPSSRDVGVGSTWSLYSDFNDYLPSNRYYPPIVKGAEATLYRLLRLLHKNAFVTPRFGPKGGYAILRAVNQEYYDIRFRFHAEFQLNEPPAPPFWFTPAQFNGSLIIAKTGLRIKHFKMEVPHNRLLNVDMEWMTSTKDEGMEVDIGHLPLMAVVTAGTSPGHERWQKQITEEEAQAELELAFYPFKKVKYYPFEEAFSQAAAEDKLVHSIAIWGALDDQSC